MTSTHTIYVVDDDSSACAFINATIDHLPFEQKSFSSVEALLLALPPEPLGCIILDVRFPGKSGVDLHKWLIERELHLPVIFISGYGDVLKAVKSMHMGAVDYIQKPIRPQRLLDSIQRAIAEAERCGGAQS